MFCESCKIANSPEARYCKSCGKILKTNSYPCPQCTVISPVPVNFCSVCNYNFQTLKTTSHIDYIEKGEFSCPNCTFNCEKKVNFCPVCDYQFFDQIKDTNSPLGNFAGLLIDDKEQNDFSEEFKICSTCDAINKPFMKNCINCGNDLISKTPGEALQLVSLDKDGKFVINEMALQILQKLEGNVAVCNVIGPLRTGKSYILNILLNKKNGFELGGNVDSCTRGIWMWDTPIKHKNKHGEFNLILLDTEGLGSTDRDPHLDNIIFVLSLLLSSFFVLNTKNVIDRDAIKKLAIMTDLSKFINSSIGENQEQKLVVSSPDFVWVLRDFFLNLNGRTPKKYLEECLEMEIVGVRNAEAIKEANFIRESIKTSFKSLNCFCLPFPIKNGLCGMSFQEVLQYLDQVDFKDLGEDFRDGINELCTYIKDNICPKSVLTIALTGVAFSSYFENVVKQLNEDERVSLADSLALSIKYASEKAFKDAIDNYELRMQQFLNQNPLPLRWDILDAKNREIMDSCYKILEKNLNGSNDLTRPVLESFQEEICEYEGNGNNIKLTGGLFFKIQTDNSIKIKAFNKNVLNNLWQTDIAGKFFNGVQDQNMGQNFIVIYERLKTSYNQKSFHGIEPEMSESFNEWYKEKDIASVINNMRFLSEQVKANLEKEQQIRNEKANRERIEKDFQNAINLQQENNRNLNEKIRVMEITHANQVKSLGDKLNNAQVAAQAAQQAAAAANNHVASLRNNGGGGGRRKKCVIS